MRLADAPQGSPLVASLTLDSISVKFITAVVGQQGTCSRPSWMCTILNLPYPCLQVVERQVADLRLEAFEIHDGRWLSIRDGTRGERQDRRAPLSSCKPRVMPGYLKVANADL
jgi:hypothetical protein